VTEVGSLGAGLSSDWRPSYLLYFVLSVHDNKQTYSKSSSWRGRSQAKWTQSESSKLKWTQLVWPCETSSRQRH